MTTLAAEAICGKCEGFRRRFSVDAKYGKPRRSLTHAVRQPGENAARAPGIGISYRATTAVAGKTAQLQGPEYMLRWIDTLKMRLQRRRRARKVENLQAWSRGLGVEATFEKIYADSKWGRGPDESRFFSGDGSRPENSGPYETFVSGFLHDHPEIGSLVDIGCGDFQVSGRILRRLSRSIDYTGCDVARSVVEHNKHTHSRQGVRFVHVDVVDADPPAGDAVTIRQVLQHLSNAQIARVLERLARLYKVAIITEALPVKFVAANIDIEHGSAVRIPLGSGVYIDEPPYGMKVAEAFDSPCSRKEFLRTSVVWFDRPVSDPAN